MADRREAPLSIRAAAAEVPTSAALISAEGTLTFADLADRTKRIAAWLATREDMKNGFALVAALRVETFLLFLAAFELGIPVFVVHPRLTTSERRALTDIAGVPAFDETWTESRIGGTDDVRDEDVSPRRIPEEAPLAILFTSGSSGAPKGVVLSRRAFLCSAAASEENFGWNDDDRWLLSMPLGHVGGLSVLVRCLIARKPVVLLPWTGDIAAFLAGIAAHRATILSLVPTMLAKICETVSGPPFASHVRIVMLGGDAATASLLAVAKARAVPALTTYGLTEACSQVATQRYGEAPSTAVGAGPPLAGTEVRIADDGEILVRGRTMMTGYFPLAAASSPFLEGGWFATGDLGELDAKGRLHVLGRKKDMIITGGENVYPREVEQALERCPEIAESCVFGIPDERWGQIVAAAIVPREPATADIRDVVRTFAAENLAAHKRPRAIVSCERLPLNATGKLDRKRVAEELAARVERL